MPIQPGDLSKLRDTQHTIPGKYWDVWPRVEVGSAVIAQASFSYPLGELTITEQTDGWETLVQVGMYYEIHETIGEDAFITSGVVRKPPEGNTFFIDQKSLGDPGAATRIIRSLNAGQLIRVYHFRPLWALLSRIHENKFYKKFDIPYSDQGINGTPVVNIGEWRYAVVPDTTTRATFGFTASLNTSLEHGSYAHFGKVIDSVQWHLPAEANVISGDPEAPTVVFTLPVGFYLIGCTLTQNTGDSKTAYRPVWVRSRNGPIQSRPFSEQYAITVESDQQSLQGREITLTIHMRQDQEVPDLLPGAAFIYYEDSRFDGARVSDGTLTDLYVGYVVSSTQGGSHDDRTLTVNLRSPFQVLEQIATVSQAIVEKQTPSNWTHVLRGYADPNLLVWYVLEHHEANFLTLFDFYRMVQPLPPRKRRYALNGSTIQQQLQEIASLILESNIGSESAGGLHFKVNASLQSMASRFNMDTRLTIGDDDIQSPIKVDEIYRPPVGQVILYAFFMQNNKPVPIASVAPGRAQGQGTGRINGQSVISTSQDRLNEESGHWLALQNNPMPELPLLMNRNLDIFDPARHFITWFDYNFSARFSPYNVPLEGRGIVSSVTRTWEKLPNNTFVKTINATLIPETFGQWGETLPVDGGGGGSGGGGGGGGGSGGGGSGTGGGGPSGGGGGIIPPPPEDPFARRFAVAWDDQGGLARTFNMYGALETQWTDIKGGITGNVCDLDFDWWSSYPRSGFLNGSLGAWCCSLGGGLFRIYYAPDLFASTVAWELRATFLTSGTAPTTAAHIIASRETQNLVVAAWHDGMGVICVTTQNGTFFSSRDVGQRIVENPINNNRDFGFDLDGQRTICTGIDSNGDWRLFRRDTLNGAFSVIEDSPVSESPYPTAHVNEGGILFTGTADYTQLATTEVFNDTVLGPDPNDYTPPPTVTGYSDCFGAGTSAQFYTPNNPPAPGFWVFVGQGGKGVCVEVTFPEGQTVDVTGFGYNGSSAFQRTGGSGIFGYVAHSVLFYNSFGTLLRTATRTSQSDPSGFSFSSALAFDWPGVVKGVNRMVFRVKVPAREDGPFGPITTDAWMTDLFFTSSLRQSFDARFYRVLSYTSGAPTWTDVSPVIEGTKLTAATQYALALDPANAGEFSGFFTPGIGQGQKLYRSANGNSYTEVNLPISSYRGLFRSGQMALIFGEQKLAISQNYGASPQDIIGDWGEAIGTVGEFLGIKAII